MICSVWNRLRGIARLLCWNQTQSLQLWNWSRLRGPGHLSLGRITRRRQRGIERIHVQPCGQIDEAIPCRLSGILPRLFRHDRRSFQRVLSHARKFADLLLQRQTNPCERRQLIHLRSGFKIVRSIGRFLDGSERWYGLADRACTTRVSWPIERHVGILNHKRLSVCARVSAA